MIDEGFSEAYHKGIKVCIEGAKLEFAASFLQVE